MKIRNKLDSTKKYMRQFRALRKDGLQLTRTTRLQPGYFATPMVAACAHKGGMGLLRHYQTQPHEAWFPVKPRKLMTRMNKIIGEF